MSVLLTNHLNDLKDIILNAFLRSIGFFLTIFFTTYNDGKFLKKKTQLKIKKYF